MGSSHYLEDGLPVDGSVVGIIPMFGSTPWVLKKFTQNVDSRGFWNWTQTIRQWSLNYPFLGGKKTLAHFPENNLAHCWGWW